MTKLRGTRLHATRGHNLVRFENASQRCSVDAPFLGNGRIGEIDPLSIIQPCALYAES